MTSLRTGHEGDAGSDAAPTRARHVVFAMVLALAAISYLDRVCISMAGPFLQKDLGLGDAQLGWVFSAFTFAYALFEMPAGWLADRFGPRLMLSRVVVWWSIMTAATGWVGGFVALLAVRLLFGAGEAGTFPGIARVYSRWLPQRFHGAGFGIAVTAGALGGAITQPLTAWLLPLLGWRRIFEVYALVGIAWALVWFLWFRDDPHDHTAVNAA